MICSICQRPEPHEDGTHAFDGAATTIRYPALAARFGVKKTKKKLAARAASVDEHAVALVLVGAASAVPRRRERATCGRCGIVTPCRVWECRRCELEFHACAACERETGGLALDYAKRTHERRAH